MDSGLFLQRGTLRLHRRDNSRSSNYISPPFLPPFASESTTESSADRRFQPVREDCLQLGRQILKWLSSTDQSIHALRQSIVTLQARNSPSQPAQASNSDIRCPPNGRFYCGKSKFPRANIEEWYCSSKRFVSIDRSCEQTAECY